MLLRSEDIFLNKIDNSVATTIRCAMDAVDKSDSDKAWNLLRPLVNKNNGAAIFYAASISLPNETQEEFEQRHIKQLEKSAKIGYVPAIHELAIRFDSGDPVVRNTNKAALLFREAAQKGHPHAQWIHGEDLLYGRNGIEKNEKLGIEYITKSADAKFEGALMTMAEFHEKGQYGFPKDLEKASVIKQQIDESDVIRY